jgi:hypothetical protein
MFRCAVSLFRSFISFDALLKSVSSDKERSTLKELLGILYLLFEVRFPFHFFSIFIIHNVSNQIHSKIKLQCEIDFAFIDKYPIEWVNATVLSNADGFSLRTVQMMQLILLFDDKKSVNQWLLEYNHNKGKQCGFWTTVLRSCSTPTAPTRPTDMWCTPKYSPFS